MTRRTDPSTASTASTPPAATPTGPVGRRGLAALVVSAIEDGSLAFLPDGHGLDPCAVIEATVPALTLGDLGAQDTAWAERHLETCPECRTLLGQSRQLDALLGQESARLAEPRTGRSEADRRSVPARFAARQSADRATVWSMATPVGDVFVAVSDRGVCEVDFASTADEQAIVARLRSRGYWPELIAGHRRDGDAVTIGRQVVDYLSGKRRSLDLPYDLGPVSPFTRQVLEAATTIPFGSVSTYGALAHRIGQPGASRAIGNALGRNPVPLIIPCHRVVRSDLTAGGFVGGTEIKQQLLTLEGAMFNRAFPAVM